MSHVGGIHLVHNTICPLYLVISFGVKNGIKGAIQELDVRFENKDGLTQVVVTDIVNPDDEDDGNDEEPARE